MPQSSGQPEQLHRSRVQLMEGRIPFCDMRHQAGHERWPRGYRDHEHGKSLYHITSDFRQIWLRYGQSTIRGTALKSAPTDVDSCPQKGLHGDTYEAFTSASADFNTVTYSGGR